MKTIKIVFFISLASVLLACSTSGNKITDDFLVGTWRASGVSTTDSVYLFDKPFSPALEEISVITFTPDLVDLGDGELIAYQFSASDSMLIMNNEAETIRLMINTEDEFSTRDNMGLILKFKRIR